MGIEAWKRGIAKRNCCCWPKLLLAGSLGLGVFDPLRGLHDVDGGMGGWGGSMAGRRLILH
jgi:hypothetical protein